MKREVIAWLVDTGRGFAELGIRLSLTGYARAVIEV
jgi:hypothetical protein